MNLKCKKHPRYQAKRKPRCVCYACWCMWFDWGHKGYRVDAGPRTL